MQILCDGSRSSTGIRAEHERPGSSTSGNANKSGDRLGDRLWNSARNIHD
jgi:hypothetical protein